MFCRRTSPNGKAAALKAAGPFGPWGFESLVLRKKTYETSMLKAHVRAHKEFILGEVAELAEGTRLLSERGVKASPRVRIPPSPQKY